jgi:hypothetical protein
MTPFLTTLGGGSARGFGRGRLGAVIPAVVLISASTTNNYTNISYTSNVSTGFRVFLFDAADNTIASDVYAQTNGTIQRYESCTSKTYYARLYNDNTNQYASVASNNLSHTYPSLTNGTLISSVCSGNDEIFTRSNGSCGTYTQTSVNTLICNPPISNVSWTFEPFPSGAGTYQFGAYIFGDDSGRLYTWNYSYDVYVNSGAVGGGSGGGNQQSFITYGNPYFVGDQRTYSPGDLAYVVLTITTTGLPSVTYTSPEYTA